MTGVRLVAIGASLGGLDALATLLRGVPATCAVPLVLVLHRGGSSGEELVDLLQERTALTVREAEDHEPLRPGHLYLAPADYHLLVDPETLLLCTEAPVHSARPSIDVLLDSVALGFGPRAAAVLLTGSTEDGADGARALSARGGRILVQDPAEAQAPELPRAAIRSAPGATVLGLDQLALALRNLLEKR